MTQTVYFVVSLPRTGTTSLCRMAHLCGLRPKHAPGEYLDDYLSGNKFDLYADTPIFVPSVVDSLCRNRSITPKFVYIDRNPRALIASWVNVRLFRNYQRLYARYYDPSDGLAQSPQQKFDFVSYLGAFGGRKLDEASFQSIFAEHRTTVLEVIASHNKEVLTYSFSQGWEPFCAFLGCERPAEEIPRLNVGKMFDKFNA